MKIFLYAFALIVIVATLAVAGSNALRITGSSNTFVTKEDSEENWRKNEERWGANADLWNKQIRNNRQETARTKDHILDELQRHNEEFAQSPPVPDQSRSDSRRPFRPARPTRDRSRPADACPPTTPVAPLLVGLTDEQLAMLQEASDNTIRLNTHENRIAALERHEGPLNPHYASKAEFVTLSEGFARIQSTLCEIKESLATTTPTAPTTTEK